MQHPSIMAYAMNRGLLTMTEDDAKRLTHVNLAFGVLRDGLVTIDGLPDIGRIERIRAWNPQIQIVLSIGGWGAGGFSTMAMTPEGRARFIESAVKILDEHRLNGVDIDWEYPCNGAADIDYDPRDRENFTSLMAELKDAAGGRSVSIAAGAGDYFTRDTEMDKVGAICDYVQLMTYDLGTGADGVTGHHTALSSWGGVERDSVRTAVARFINAGVPREKLVIGAAFYSRIWENVPPDNNGIGHVTGRPARSGIDYTRLSEEYFDEASGFKKYWDDEAGAPYLFDGSTLISYDDPTSIRNKCAYVLEEGLKGIMYWEHGCDRTHTLLAAMAEAFR